MAVKFASRPDPAAITGEKRLRQSQRSPKLRRGAGGDERGGAGRRSVCGRICSAWQPRSESPSTRSGALIRPHTGGALLMGGASSRGWLKTSWLGTPAAARAHTDLSPYLCLAAPCWSADGRALLIGRSPDQEENRQEGLRAGDQDPGEGFRPPPSRGGREGWKERDGREGKEREE